MEIFTTALSGVGISVVGLCLLRSWRSRSWASVSRVAHLADKTLTGQVSSNVCFFHNLKIKCREHKVQEVYVIIICTYIQSFYMI